MKQVVSCRLKAVLENIPKATEFVTQAALAAGLGGQELYQVQLAVDEACANVVRHAYQGMEPGDMEICCDYNGQTFCIQVRDWGRGFDLREVPEPPIHAPLEERTLGGLGLFLIKKTMDQVYQSYYPGQGNVLVMVKRLHCVRR